MNCLMALDEGCHVTMMLISGICYALFNVMSLQVNVVISDSQAIAVSM